MGYKMLHTGIKSLGFQTVAVVALVLNQESAKYAFFSGSPTSQQLPEIPHDLWSPQRGCIRVTAQDGHTYVFNTGGPYYWEPKGGRQRPLALAKLDPADIWFEVSSSGQKRFLTYRLASVAGN